MAQNKKVSVVIPNYNYAKFLQKRVETILAQTYPIYELLIMDDASRDGSVAKIRELVEFVKKKYPEMKVKTIFNTKNSGNVYAQWAKGFSETTGDFVWIAEADDLCNKRFLEKVMPAFDDDGVVISYAESRLIDENGRIRTLNARKWVDMFNTGHWKKSYVNNGRQELREVLYINNTIPNVSGVVFRKMGGSGVLLKKAQRFRLAGDWYFYAKLLLKGKIAYNKKSLNYHRVHNGGVTSTTRAEEYYNEVVSMQDMITNEIGLDDVMRDKIQEHRVAMQKRLGL